MIRRKLHIKYPEIHQEVEFRDIEYQRHIHQNKLPFSLSWLDEGRQPYRNIEMSIWDYLDNKVIDHNQAIRTFFNLMIGYYGFELPGDENAFDFFDIMAFSK